MVVGLVFLYLVIFLYGALLLLLAGLAIYASYRFDRRTTHALLGLVGWLLTAPILVVVLFVALDAVGLAQAANRPGFGLLLLFAYSVCSPLFLVPLGVRLFGAREKPPLPA